MKKFENQRKSTEKILNNIRKFPKITIDKLKKNVPIIKFDLYL